MRPPAPRTQVPRFPPRCRGARRGGAPDRGRPRLRRLDRHHRAPHAAGQRRGHRQRRLRHGIDRRAQHLLSLLRRGAAEPGAPAHPDLRRRRRRRRHHRGLPGAARPHPRHLRHHRDLYPRPPRRFHGGDAHLQRHRLRYLPRRRLGEPPRQHDGAEHRRRSLGAAGQPVRRRQRHQRPRHPRRRRRRDLGRHRAAGLLRLAEPVRRQPAGLRLDQPRLHALPLRHLRLQHVGERLRLRQRRRHRRHDRPLQPHRRLLQHDRQRLALGQRHLEAQHDLRLDLGYRCARLRHLEVGEPHHHLHQQQRHQRQLLGHLLRQLQRRRQPAGGEPDPSTPSASTSPPTPARRRSSPTSSSSCAIPGRAAPTAPTRRSSAATRSTR